MVDKITSNSFLRTDKVQWVGSFSEIVSLFVCLACQAWGKGEKAISEIVLDKVRLSRFSAELSE